MSPSLDEQLQALRKQLSELDAEVVRIAESASLMSTAAEEIASASPAPAPGGSTGTGAPVYTPVLAADRGGEVPATMNRGGGGLKGQIAEKVGEVLVEKAAEEIADKASQGTTITATSYLVFPCGFSGEVDVTAQGSVEVWFWWNATDGEISDYAPTANEQAKQTADAALDVRLGALLADGCTEPCKPTVQIVGDRSYAYTSARTKLDTFTTDVKYTCTASQKVNLTCA